MVSFHENPEKYDNPLIMETINQKMFECIDIDSSIREMDKEITTHPHYIQKCHGSSASLVDDPSEHLLQSNF
jgi:COP9 signalosome complex subunit 3